MAYVIVAVVCLVVGALGGGYAGFRWGKSAAAKVAAVVGAVKS